MSFSRRYLLLVSFVLTGQGAFAGMPDAVWNSYMKEGSNLESEGRYKDAIQLFQSSVEEARKGGFKEGLSSALFRLGCAEITIKDYKMAQLHLDESLRLAEALYGPESYQAGACLEHSSEIAFASGDFDLAMNRLKRALSYSQRLHGQYDARSQLLFCKMAVVQIGRGRRAEAIALLKSGSFTPLSDKDNVKADLVALRSKLQKDLGIALSIQNGVSKSDSSQVEPIQEGTDDGTSKAVSNSKSDWVEDYSNAPSPAPKKSAGKSTPGLDSVADDLLRKSVLLDAPKPKKISSDVYKRWFESTHGSVKVEKNTIVVTHGACGSVLKLLGLPYTNVGSDLGNINLDNTKVIIVNGELTASALLSVRKFVGMGGSLITTDLALEPVMQRAFPGFVEWNGGWTPKMLADAVVVDPTSSVAKTLPSAASWSLEEKCCTIKVVRPGPVAVIARSRLLMRSDPSETGVLAFILHYGRGKALHMVGRFSQSIARGHQVNDPSPGLEIPLREAILANFLAQAL